MGKDVGNLVWFYYLIVYNEWILLFWCLFYYLVLREFLLGFKDLKIIFFNYGGEVCIYLENFVMVVGVIYIWMMKVENIYFIMVCLYSEKCEVVKDWNIEIVNYFWIEESYVVC